MHFARIVNLVTSSTTLLALDVWRDPDGLFQGALEYIQANPAFAEKAQLSRRHSAELLLPSANASPNKRPTWSTSATAITAARTVLGERSPAQAAPSSLRRNLSDVTSPVTSRQMSTTNAGQVTPPSSPKSPARATSLNQASFPRNTSLNTPTLARVASSVIRRSSDQTPSSPLSPKVSRSTPATRGGSFVRSATIDVPAPSTPTSGSVARSPLNESIRGSQDCLHEAADSPTVPAASP